MKKQQLGTWVTFDNGIEEFKIIPMYQKLIYARDDDRIFVPAIYFGNENKIFLCTSFDGTEIILDDDKHLYVPLDWAKEEFKDEEAQKMVKSLEAYVNTMVLIKNAMKN